MTQRRGQQRSGKWIPCEMSSISDVVASSAQDRASLRTLLSSQTSNQMRRTRRGKCCPRVAGPHCVCHCCRQSEQRRLHLDQLERSAMAAAQSLAQTITEHWGSVLHGVCLVSQEIAPTMGEHSRHEHGSNDSQQGWLRVAARSGQLLLVPFHWWLLDS